jgi:hypothetical protein
LILLFWLALLLAVATVVILFVTRDDGLRSLALSLTGSVLLLFLMQQILGKQAVCPLCHASFGMGSACSRHRNARHIFGSYTLRKALSILIKRYFRCIYCGEATTLKKVRTR